MKLNETLASNEDMDSFLFSIFVKMPFERDHHQWRIEEMKRRKEKDLTYSNSVAFSS